MSYNYRQMLNKLNKKLNLIDITIIFSNVGGFSLSSLMLYEDFKNKDLDYILTPYKAITSYVVGAYIGFMWPITIPISIVKTIS
jgi:hypothetical protein